MTCLHKLQVTALRKNKHEHMRDKLRPDIMLVEFTDTEREAYMAGKEMPLLKCNYA